MKISVVIFSLRHGGAERVASIIANRLSRRYNVQLILLSKQDRFYFIEESIKVEEPSFLREKTNKLIYYFKLFFYLRKQLGGSNCILSFGESINSLVLLASIGIKAQKLVSNRASPFSNLNGFRGFVNPLVYRLADNVLVQTQRAIEVLSSKYSGVKFNVLPNPYELPLDVIALEKREYNIINVGNLGGNKNQSALINYFYELRLYKQWNLLFVGAGSNRLQLESLVESLGIQQSVMFLGLRNDIPSLLQNSRVFAFTSLTEGFPNALAEAMCAGCACISFDCETGPRELIEDGRNGFLVTVNDDDTYKEKLLKLCSSEALQTEFSLKARISMRKFATESVVDRLEEYIKMKVK